ncbi:16S rRNA (uracil(1498)-N(3))-methyltransferase [Vampirovibrio sp.]|uniref:16S rRNA (uracil(1498)-N(3))-methyltransferase n=1 Tax=Vampirovibrio sp. TaxID=2717857 RepID=UPI0035938A2E
METFHLKRFFITLSGPLTSFPAEMTVEDDVVAHHLRTVMRAKAGESVVLVDGASRCAYLATLMAVERRSVQVVVQSALEQTLNCLPSVTLAVALIKEQRWDWLIQKATELGVEAIQPIASERTVIKLGEKDISKKLERWEAVIRSAAEQSEGLFVPPVLAPVSVKALCANAALQQTHRILLAERGAQRDTLKTVLSQHQPDRSLLFAIGPEGGWTDLELKCFEQSGFTFASLGQRIMRSETAALAAMAAVVYEWAPS